MRIKGFFDVVIGRSGRGAMQRHDDKFYTLERTFTGKAAEDFSNDDGDVSYLTVNDIDMVVR